MSDEVSKDVWSKQFYKALEAVGNLTEQERLKLGNMLIALSPTKQPDKLLRAIEDAQSSLEEQKRIFNNVNNIGVKYPEYPTPRPPLKEEKIC